MAKVKKTLTLDESVVEAFARDDPDNLSGTVNGVLVAEQERRFRRRALASFLDALEAEVGPASEAEVDRFAAMLA